MYILLLTIFPALSQETTPFVSPNAESASTQTDSKKHPIDAFFDYALIHKYGATLASIGMQMDTSRYTQFQVIGPTV